MIFVKKLANYAQTLEQQNQARSQDFVKGGYVDV